MITTTTIQTARRIGQAKRKPAMQTNATTKKNPTIPPEVSKKLVLSFPPDDGTRAGKRVSPETAAAVSEALRLFLVSAHHRASIEAECEEEGDLNDNTTNQGGGAEYTIRANHVTRIAGELLIDFS